jgi:hypothetical protein
MADRVLFIGWSTPVRGREKRGLEVFNEAMGLYGRMQQDGRIESFDVTLLDPNGRLNGFMQLRGTAGQIAAVRMDEDFRRMTIDASLIVDDMQMFEGSCNEGIARDMGLYQEALDAVPQHA